MKQKSIDWLSMSKNTILKENPPSSCVQARVRGAANAVVIYPISQTIAVAGILFF